MKKLFPLKLIILASFLAINSVHAQPWQLGGNAGPPMTLTNNFLGSDAATNYPIRFGTFGINRMFIHDNTGPNAGFIGMGNGFTNPQAVLNINTLGNGTGNVFRTDGPNAQANVWSMFTGTSTGTTEKGAIFTGGNLEGRK